jgi:sarcosine oxidase
MAAAGAPHTVTDDRPPLPAPGAVGPFLVDPSGGVVRARVTGEFLRAGVPVVASRVLAVEGDRVVTAAGGERFDAVVLAAGAGTAALAAGCGIEVPAAQAHHARFTFPLRDPTQAPPCWIDRSGAWRAGFTSYGHLVRPGYWAIGGHPPDLDESWAAGREAVTAASRQAVLGYVSEHVTALRAEVVETVYCAFPPGLGDGVHVASAGPVTAVWGDNLFKFAPVIGRMVAAAATT